MAEPRDWDRPALSLHEAARLTGALAWAEKRLYEILGGWVPSTGPVEAKFLLACRSPQHEEHAQWLHRRLPQLAGVDPVALAGPPSPAADGCLEELARLSDPAERLAAVYRGLLPALVGTQRRLLRAANPVSDGPVARAVRMVLAEETEEVQEAEEVLAGLLATESDHERAALIAARFSWRWAQSGGVEGPERGISGK